MQQRAMLKQTEGADRERELAFSIGCAYTQTITGDVQQAMREHQRIEYQLERLGSDRAEKLSAQVSRKKQLWKSGTDQVRTLDYNRRPFESMYFWTPFILIGDWQ